MTIKQVKALIEKNKFSIEGNAFQKAYNQALNDILMQLTKKH